MKFFTTLLSALIIFMNGSQVDAKEVKGVVRVVDEDPLKISWIQKKEAWVLIVYFEEGELKTYFENRPPLQGLGLSSDNKPFKQELKFDDGHKFISTNYQYEQDMDGIKKYAFSYEGKVTRGSDEYNIHTEISEGLTKTENFILQCFPFFATKEVHVKYVLFKKRP